MLKLRHHYPLITIVFAGLLVLFALTLSPTAAEPISAAESYPELGIMTNFDYLKPSIGYWWGNKGLRLTGVYLDDERYSFHLNVAYELSAPDRWQHSLNLLTNWYAGSDPGAIYQYAATGLAYSVNYQGFFVEMGLCVPWRDDIGNLASDPVVPCGYWGFVYRFKPKPMPNPLQVD
jgi:hypothetical protein